VADTPVSNAKVLMLQRDQGALVPLPTSSYADNEKRASAADGSILLKDEVLNGSLVKDGRLYISHPEYRISEFLLHAAQRIYRVRLAKGYTQRIRAQRENGNPIAGIKFRLVRRGVGLEFERLAVGNGVFVDPSDRDARQWIGETDQDGWAQVAQLGEGPYLLEPVFGVDEFVPRADQGAVVVRPPYDEQTVIFVEPLALVEAVKGDKVHAGMTHDERIWWTFRGKAVKWCLSKKRALEREFPDAYVSVRLPRRGAYDGSPVNISLRTESHGWVDTSVRFRPLGSFTRPRVHVAANRAVVPGSFDLVIEAPNGKSLGRAHGFRLTRQDATSTSGDYRLLSSTTTQVAPGDYLLRSPRQWPGKKIIRPVRIRSGTESRLVVKLDEPIVPHEIRILCPGGRWSVSGAFTFSIEDTASGGMNYGPGLNPTKGLWFWLREGARFEYMVRAFGYPPLAGVFLGRKADAPAESRIIDIRLSK